MVPCDGYFLLLFFEAPDVRDDEKTEEFGIQQIWVIVHEIFRYGLAGESVHGLLIFVDS